RCREEEPNPAVVPAVVVQASPEDIGASARLDYYRQILDQLRKHVGVQEFVGALRSLLERVPLSVDVPGLLSHWRWFGEWSLGCIGVLSDWLVETVDTLCKEGATTLTIEALTKHALQPDQRLRMEMEARTGEYKVERAKAQSEQDLKLLLANPTTLPISQGTPAFGNGASALSATPEVASRTHTRSRIEREAFRDPIGDQVVNALKCSFSGVLSIELKQFLDSGIRLFECPECARMRSLSPRNGVLRFPSHDQRKGRTPNTEQRWAREKTIWEVVGGERT
ncbi:MAG TPA: hypothetical protein VGT82_09670, partial [Ktedonobacteraceae bacterium]|nr:hypothetical protein [Ktedonobacteraceae bacterium]